MNFFFNVLGNGNVTLILVSTLAVIAKKTIYRVHSLTRVLWSRHSQRSGEIDAVEGIALATRIVEGIALAIENGGGRARAAS